jgi:hypothetical protein
MIEPIAEQVRGIPGVETEIRELFPGSHPLLVIRLDDAKVGRSASEVVQRLRDGEPRVFVIDMLAPFGMLFISSVNMLHEEQVKIVGQQLYAALKS